ncbi:MAG TPA: hydroxymethylglutaryl-CoA lyase [Gaiellales bacterium]|jgi:hydroxymethylglutaryl-CoA lyase|nr:hydroxymethylglutaryl-CoA lyase [Gaiellales bacterium]
MTAADVTVVEVGPRDGLQNEQVIVPADAKLELIDRLAAAGLPVIEATSFVSRRAVPQLGDADEVMRALRRLPGVRYPVLVPNTRGLERAQSAGATEIAVFTAASESFCQANIGMSIDRSLEVFREVVGAARRAGMWVRGYVSTAFGCPYEGAVEPAAVARVAAALDAMGCAEISIGDTIGVAVPEQVPEVIGAVADEVPVERLALHLHDTRGNALQNVDAGLVLGVRTFDSSAAGLGGCPFAPGAPGNLATESLVEHLRRQGLDTGVDATAVAKAGAFVRGLLA